MQERTNWTAREAPGKQERTIWTAREAPARQERTKGSPVLRGPKRAPQLKGRVAEGRGRYERRFQTGSPIKRAGC